MLKILTDMQRETYCMKWDVHYKLTNSYIEHVHILHILYTNNKNM